MTLNPEPTPQDLGYQFALALLADPAVDTAALDQHPLSSAYRLCWSKLLFQCGRQTGLVDLGDAEAGEFLVGFTTALADREGLQFDSGPGRQDDPN